MRSRRDRDSGPPDHRPVFVLVAVTVALLVAVGLGVRYAGEAHPRWLDRMGLSLARGWLPIPRGQVRAVIGLFDPLPLAVLVAALAGICLALRRRRLAVLAVAGPVLTGIATSVLKPVVERTKDGDLAYPSGHMGAAVALAVVVALLIVSLLELRRRAAVVVLALVPGLVGAGMGLAMTVTGYHYLTDAVGGFCVAVAVVLGLAVLLDRRSSGRYGALGGVASRRRISGKRAARNNPPAPRDGPVGRSAQ